MDDKRKKRDDAGPGLGRIRGKWPGDESIEQILDALDDTPPQPMNELTKAKDDLAAAIGEALKVLAQPDMALIKELRQLHEYLWNENIAANQRYYAARDTGDNDAITKELTRLRTYADAADRLNDIIQVYANK